MTTTRQRNAQIVEMRERGVSRQEVARRFRITPGRVAMIDQDCNRRLAQGNAAHGIVTQREFQILVSPQERP